MLSFLYRVCVSEFDIEGVQAVPVCLVWSSCLGCLAAKNATTKNLFGQRPGMEPQSGKRHPFDMGKAFAARSLWNENGELVRIWIW